MQGSNRRLREKLVETNVGGGVHDSTDVLLRATARFLHFKMVLRE